MESALSQCPVTLTPATSRQPWRQQRLLDGGGEFELAPGKAGTNGLLFVAAAEHLLDEELGEGVDDVHLSGIEGLGRIMPAE